MIQHHLFTSNFNCRFIKRLLGIVIGLLLFFIGCSTLNKLYVEEEAWSRILYHNFYNQDDIDHLFLGSSHVFMDINPYIVEEKMGGKAFNMSTSGQRVIESYYNLLEADRKYNIKNAYVELYYLVSTGEYADYSNLKNSLWLNTDYYEPSLIKVRALSHNKIENMPEALLPFIRFREHLFNKEWINARLSEKSSMEYISYMKKEDYSDGNGYYEYMDKGEFACTRIMNPHSEVYQPELSNSYRRDDEMYLNADVQKYMRKIKEYCDKNDINLIFFSSPLYPTVTQTVDYDRYYNNVLNTCNELGVSYYDFNMCKGNELPILDAQYYMDNDHLNSLGQAVFTNYICDVFSSGVNIPEAFYSSYSERCNNEYPKVYGLYSIPELNSDGLRMVNIASDCSDGLMYKIIVNKKTIFEDGTETDSETSVYEMGVSDSFLVYPGTYGTCIIESADRQTGQILGVDEFQFNIR